MKIGNDKHVNGAQAPFPKLDTPNPDRRPEWEKQRDFIQAAKSLKTLRVTPEGSTSIDPQKIREQVLDAREPLRHFVHRR